MRIIPSTSTRAVAALLDRRPRRDAAFERRVARIVERVRTGGDPALLAYARRFDWLTAGRFDGLTAAMEVGRDEMEAAAGRVSPEVRASIVLAARHIARVARRQMPKPWAIETTPGVRLEQRVVPLDRVGCYVPAGRYPLPSSLLMTAVPARVAGVGEIVAVCPRPDETVMCAAIEAGVTRLFRVGGAHAIAALAYGTRTIPSVDKIVGPGNRYVAAAKAIV